MGCKFNQQKEFDNNYVDSIHNLGKIFYHRIVRPWTYQDTIFKLFFKEGKLENTLLNSIKGFTNNIIRKREESFEKVKNRPEEKNENNKYYGRKKMAMLDLLLNSKLAHGSIDDEGIEDEVNTIMFEVSLFRDFFKVSF